MVLLSLFISKITYKTPWHNRYVNKVLFYTFVSHAFRNDRHRTPTKTKTLLDSIARFPHARLPHTFLTFNSCLVCCWTHVYVPTVWQLLYWPPPIDALKNLLCTNKSYFYQLKKCFVVNRRRQLAYSFVWRSYYTQTWFNFEFAVLMVILLYW